MRERRGVGELHGTNRADRLGRQFLLLLVAAASVIDARSNAMIQAARHRLAIAIAMVLS